MVRLYLESCWFLLKTDHGEGMLLMQAYVFAMNMQKVPRTRHYEWTTQRQFTYSPGQSSFQARFWLKSTFFPLLPFSCLPGFLRYLATVPFLFLRTRYYSIKYLYQSLLITLTPTKYAHSHYFSHGPNFFIPGANALRRANIITSNKMHSISLILSPSMVDKLTWENQGITTTQKRQWHSILC